VTSVPGLLDHLVYATPDLEETLKWFEATSGVRPLPGGIHPAWRTQNAILPLSSSTYLEIVGPDHSAHGDPPTIFHLDSLSGPRLVTWAAKGRDLHTLAARARLRGIELGGPTSGSRQRLDGSRLTWNLTDPLQSRSDGVLPFFIDWGSSPHPAAMALPEITLTDLHAEHPDPLPLRAHLTVLGLDLRVEHGPFPRLLSSLMTPRGVLTLT